MKLRFLRDALMPELNGDAGKALFDDAKTRHSVLSKYQSPPAVLAAMGDVHGAPWPEREALTRTLLAEAQTRPCQFWSALLLAAYYPMLLRLRGRIRGCAIDSADIDQMVVVTFLDVARNFPLEQRKNRCCMHLRQMTQRQVFQVVRRGSAIQALTSLQSVENVDPAKLPPWPSPRSRHRAKPDSSPVDDSEAIALLASQASSVSKDQTKLLVATVVRGESLRLHVERGYPQHDSAERDRIYQRLKRQRTRTLVRLRPLFADLRSSELGEPEVFLAGSQP
jgi:hypothetical protein